LAFLFSIIFLQEDHKKSKKVAFYIPINMGIIISMPTIKVGIGNLGAKMAPISPKNPPMRKGMAVVVLFAFGFA
jgi:hypothetical protein